MSDERVPELGEEGFGGGEEVREEEAFRDGEEMQEVGEQGEEIGVDDADNEVGEEEDFGVGEEVIEDDDELGEEGEEFSGEEENYSVENDIETMSVSPSSKRIKEMSIDRLSALPDIVLFRILSFLDTKEAAMTAVLSKRWQFLWMYTPWIKLREKSNEIEKIRKFVRWVNRTLVICNVKHLIDFEVEFAYDKCFSSDVNVWVESAVRNKVNGISLLLNSSPCKDFYTLPHMFFYNSSLTRVRLRGCIMAPRRTIEWQSLTGLYLEEMELPQDVIEKILSGCPDLSNLLLRACWGFNRLNISQKLDSLGVGDAENGKREPLLEISAPNTDAILITQYPMGRPWRLTNIPSVVTATIDFNGSDWDASFEEVMSNTKYLFENLQHAKELVLGCRCIEVLSVMAVNGWQLPQSSRESLIVNVRCEENNISGIVSLLESSPKVETLVIDGYKSHGAPVSLGHAVRRDLDCELLHLKTVRMAISPDPNLDGKPMLRLAQILLKRAVVLEKMVIDVEFTSDFVSVIQTLLSYPRSSKTAAIILN